MVAKLQVVLTALCGVFLVAAWIFPGVAWLPYVAVAAGSWFAGKEAWETLRERKVDVHVLMVLAAACAVAVGHPDEAAVLLFLFSLSNTLEAFAARKTSSAIEALVKLRPATATVVREGKDQEVPVEDVRVGDEVRLMPYGQIPLDGVIRVGETHVDQVAMTGESVPISRKAGEVVLAGTQNLESMVVISVTAASTETTLSRVVALVQEAQENKASGERVSSWFGSRYTWFVLGAFGLSLILRMIFSAQNFPNALYHSLGLLVALSPCALVISSPAATLSALAWAARRGILVRGGEVVEACGTVDTVMMDKTGTLTTGRPVLVEVCLCTTREVAVGSCSVHEACWHKGDPFSPDAKRLLSAAAVAEQYSDHPIALAILRAAREQQLDVPEADRQSVASGKGVSAVWNGKVVRVGQESFFDPHEIPAGITEHLKEMRAEGMTVALMEMGGEMAALGLRDEPKAGAKESLASLREMGVPRLVMATGDNQTTAEAVAGPLGITEIHAGLMPDEKEKILRDLTSQGSRVMMVGDGVNDAPTLAGAQVGVAMGGLGSDVAMRSADVVLMHDKLERLPELIALGRQTNRVIRANLFFAGGVIAVLTLMSLILPQVLPASVGLVLPLAVVGHEGSTVLVILNGLRLLRGPRLPRSAPASA